MVEDHPEAHNPVILPPFGIRQEENPDYRRGEQPQPPHAGKPPQPHPGGPQQHHEDAHIDHAGAHIAADGGDKAHHKQGVPPHLEQGGQGADVPLVLLNPVDLIGQQEDEGDFHHLVGLDVQRKAGDGQPVQVARAVVGAQRGAQQQDKADVKEHQKLPAPGGEQLKVH